MNDHIRRLCRKKWKAWTQSRDSKDPMMKDQYWNKYLNLQDQVRTKLEAARNEFTTRLLDDSLRGNIKKFYALIKSKRKDQVSRIPILKEGDKVLSHPKEKAEAFSRQYDSVFTVEPSGSVPTYIQLDLQIRCHQSCSLKLG